MANLLVEGIDDSTGESKIFNPATDTFTIIAPTAAPSSNGQISVVSGVLQAHDGTSAKPYLRTDTFASNSYSGGDIGIGTTTDGAFADVDATNAQITFTVNTPGRYLVNFIFTKEAVGDTGAALSSRTAFRLTDGTNNSDPLKGGGSIPPVLLFSDVMTVPFTISYVFNFTSTGSKTVKLQKKNTVSINVNSRVVSANSEAVISMFAVRVAD